MLVIGQLCCARSSKLSRGFPEKGLQCKSAVYLKYNKNGSNVNNCANILNDWKSTLRMIQDIFEPAMVLSEGLPLCSSPEPRQNRFRTFLTVRV